MKHKSDLIVYWVAVVILILVTVGVIATVKGLSVILATAVTTALFIIGGGILLTIALVEILQRATQLRRARRASLSMPPREVRDVAIIGTVEKLRSLPVGRRLIVTLRDTSVEWTEEPAPALDNPDLEGGN